MKTQQETGMLLARALRVMRETRKLLQQREGHLKQLDRFLEQRQTITDEILRDAVIRIAPR